MEHNRCPLCGTQYNEEDACSLSTAQWGSILRCKGYDRTCVVHDSIDYIPPNLNSNEVFKRYNAIVAHLIKEPYANEKRTYWKFFYEESTIGNPIEKPEKINIANSMMDYPNDFQKLVDKVLLSLSWKYPNIGDQILVNGHERALYYVTNNDLLENAQEIRGILERLIELGYLRAYKTSYYEITAKGWIRIGELSKAENEINQCFIAMTFEPRAAKIGQAFHDAIAECGYIPRRIDQKEHNNQIVPEIFYEIKRSKFLVVDVTFPNHGAYYEAGYGEALNKQVIVCCKQEVFISGEKPHFDIAQKSTVVWTDLDDLKRKLKTRIEATVGLNKKNVR